MQPTETGVVGRQADWKMLLFEEKTSRPRWQTTLRRSFQVHSTWAQRKVRQKRRQVEGYAV